MLNQIFCKVFHLKPSRLPPESIKIIINPSMLKKKIIINPIVLNIQDRFFWKRNIKLEKTLKHSTVNPQSKKKLLQKAAWEVWW